MTRGQEQRRGAQPRQRPHEFHTIEQVESTKTGQNAAGHSERKGDQEVDGDQDQKDAGLSLLRRRNVEEVQRGKAQESQGGAGEDSNRQVNPEDRTDIATGLTDPPRSGQPCDRPDASRSAPGVEESQVASDGGGQDPDAVRTRTEVPDDERGQDEQ